MNEKQITDKIMELEERVQKLEELQISNSPSMKENPEDINLQKIISKIDEFSTSDLSLLALYLKPKQTLSDIKNMINGWGHKENTFFEKGKFKSRIVKKGLVYKVDKNHENKDLFSLTGRGEMLVKKIMGNTQPIDKK